MKMLHRLAVLLFVKATSHGDISAAEFVLDAIAKQLRGGPRVLFTAYGYR